MSVASTNQPSFASDNGNVQSMISDACVKTEECVGDHPISATMIALGAGAAVGLLIATALTGREIEKRSYFSRLSDQIASQIGNAVPDSMNWNR